MDTNQTLRIGIASLVLALGTAICGAEDTADSLAALKSMSLEDLGTIRVETVIGASKREQKVSEAPASVSIVTQDEIKRYGYRTLADILQSLPGFYVSNDRNYAFLGTRGISLGDFNSRMLLMIDGHRVNNNLTDGAAIGPEFILDIDLIDRVEVIRGPGSVLYGNNAFFGVINVITRKGRELKGGEIAGSVASFDTYTDRVSYGNKFTNGIELLVSATVHDSAGPETLYYKEYNTPAQNNGIAQNMAAESYESFFGSLSYRDFTLQGGFINREKVNPTAQYLTTFNDPRLSTVDDRSYVDLEYAHKFPAAAVEVTAHVYYDRNEYTIDYPVGDAGATSLFNEAQVGEWWGAELHVSKRLWEQHIITAGMEYRDDFGQEKKVFDANTTYTDLRANRKSYGLFVEGDIAVRTNLHFIGGVRYDQYGDFDPSLNPRLALIYNPFPKSTVKALYGTAFRSPNFLELSDPRFQDIQPEEITSYELVYEQGIGKYLRSSLAVFYNQMDHLIIFESGNFANVDAESRGTELALEGNLTGRIRGRASYTFQQAENRSVGGGFADSPVHLFKFNLSVPLIREKLFAGLEFQYMSSRSTVYESTSGATVAGADTPGFPLVNFTLFSQNLVKNLDASASVYNLFDQAYADPSTRFHLQDQIPRDGRGFRVKLTYRF